MKVFITIIIMYINHLILQSILSNLNEFWVSDEYDWTKDFVESYFIGWFNTAENCFFMIENSARDYSNMLYFVQYCVCDDTYTNTVDLFNMYTYMYAVRALEEDADVLEKIRNIRRIKKVRQCLPLFLSRKTLPELSHLIQTFVGNEY